MTTIKDVAGLAGVSTSTVSRYLRGLKVQSAAAVSVAVAELNYVPAHAARSLRSGRHEVVGAVVPDISNPFFAAAVRGFESVYRATPYVLTLYNTDEDAGQQSRAIADIRTRVDGLILTCAGDDTGLVEDLAKEMPVVLFDRYLDPRFDCVSVDNHGGARRAAEYLVALGHVAIGEISGPLDTSPGRLRHEGFVDGLTALGIADPLRYHVSADFREKGGYQAMLNLLGLPEPPTAVFSANNLQTIGVLKALSNMGIRVPDEMSIIGFDDIELATLLQPPLTVIQRPTEAQGAIAARLLLSRLSGTGPAEPQHIVLDTNLVERASCAPHVKRGS